MAQPAAKLSVSVPGLGDNVADNIRPKASPTMG